MRHDHVPAFELRIVPAGEREYRLALWQRAVSGDGRPDARARPLASLGGVPLLVVLSEVLDTLRREGYRPSAVDSARREPLPLSDAAGVRLGLLFLALGPLARVDRMERIAIGLRGMPEEEAYYWFSKCATGREAGHARQALRILLAGE